MPKVKEVGERLTTGPVPVPVRLTVWVPGLALSVKVKVPVLVPTAVGLKVTWTVQLAPAATLEPQVLVWEKSPLAVMLLMLSAPKPVSLSVTLWGLLLVPSVCDAKVKEVGDRVTAGGEVPVPVRLADWMVGLALSVTVRVPVRVPVVVGVKVTLMVQEALEVRLEPQVLV